MKLNWRKTAVLKPQTIARCCAMVLLFPWYPSALFAESGHNAAATPAPGSAQQKKEPSEASSSSSGSKRGKNCANRFCYRRILAPDLSSPLEGNTAPFAPCDAGRPAKWDYADYRYSMVMVVASWNLASEVLISTLEPQLAEFSRRSVGVIALASHDTMSALKGNPPEPVKGADAEYFEPEPDTEKRETKNEKRRNWCLLDRNNMRVGLVTTALEDVRSPSAQKFVNRTKDASILRTVWGKNPKVPTVWLVDSRGQLLDELALPTKQQLDEVIDKLKLWTDF